MRRLIWIAGVIVVALSAYAFSQEKKPESQNSLISLKGKWTAECDAFTPEARCALLWSEGLHKKLLRVAYEVRTADGNQLFAGEGVYQISGDSYEGFWTDTNGSLHPLQATYANGALKTYWGRPETEEGKTQYALNTDGTLSVTDWVKKNGEWRQFMHAVYQREL